MTIGLVSAIWVSLNHERQARSSRYKGKLRDAHLDDSLALSRGVAVPGALLCGERSTGQAELTSALAQHASDARTTSPMNTMSSRHGRVRERTSALPLRLPIYHFPIRSDDLTSHESPETTSARIASDQTPQTLQ